MRNSLRPSHWGSQPSVYWAFPAEEAAVAALWPRPPSLLTPLPPPLRPRIGSRACCRRCLGCSCACTAAQ